MAAIPNSPFHKELSGLAFFISLPQLIASPVFVGLKHLLYHDVVPMEVKEVIDFLLISFPLTLCVAVLTLLFLKEQFNVFYLLFAVVGAALLSNCLHAVFEKIPSVGLDSSFNETFLDPANNDNGNSIFIWIGKIFGIYWQSFGPILFIQSCAIGIYAGIKFSKIDKKKKDVKK